MVYVGLPVSAGVVKKEFRARAPGHAVAWADAHVCCPSSFVEASVGYSGSRDCLTKTTTVLRSRVDCLADDDFNKRRSRSTRLREKAPIWTLKFNRHGTRMATGGQDGKVVVWNVAIPSGPRQAKGSSADGRTDSSTKGADFSQPDEDSEDTPEAGSGKRSGPVGADGAGRRDTFPTESMSSASGLSDDVGSAGLGSSDLGLGGKEHSFSGLEVRLLLVRSLRDKMEC